MSDEKIRGFCKDCNKYVVAFRPTPNHILHLLLSIFTLGFWVIIWILISIRFGGWRCSECGSKHISQTTSTLSIIIFAILMSVIIGGTKQYVDKKNSVNQVLNKLVHQEQKQEVIVEQQIEKKQVAETTARNQYKPLWIGNWGNEIFAYVFNQPCNMKNLTDAGYNYIMAVSIPAARLKNKNDAWESQGDRAITVMGCWFKKSDNLIHAKIIRKKDGNVTEQDFNMTEKIWIAQ